MHTLTKPLLVAIALAAAPCDADALLCQAVLGCSCTVDVTSLTFGAVQPLSGGTATANSDVSVDCTGVIDVAPSVLVKVSSGLRGSIADRQMQSAGGDLLHYNIYPSAISNVIVGEGTGGFPALTVSGGTLTLLHWSATANLEGRAAMAPTQRAGSYSDTVTVRIDW